MAANSAPREPAPAQETTTTTTARLAARPRPVDDDDMAAIVDGERLDNRSERPFCVHRRIHTSQAKHRNGFCGGM
jgi:hypothetical protein